ncbi:hypothetical protein BH11PLA2_BH11PLA2_06200 [soil metagenome]
MRRIAALAVVALFGIALVNFAEDKKSAEPQIGHMLFFKLKASSPEARQKLVDACNKYLSGHDGTAYYSAGIIGDDFKRDVNDRDFDVALHLVFTDKANYDKYAVAPRHLEFIAENKEGWEKVRVFDSLVTPLKK